MRALVSLFLALSIVLGPLQEINAASTPAANQSFAPNDLTPADIQLINGSRTKLERVFLVSLLNRTRLFEILNKTLFQVQNNCLHNPFNFFVTVEQSGNCPAIVANMLHNIKVNYPDIRKLYAVYNLLLNSQTLLDALTQTEGYRFGDGPARVPLTEAEAALYFSRNISQGPTDVTMRDLSFKNPFPGVTQAMLNGFYVNNVQPTPEDYQYAAADMSPMVINDPCDTCEEGVKPSQYDMSITGFFQKECSDYVGVNAAKMMSAPDYARWPSQANLICKDFHLVFNRDTQKFSFVLVGLPRDSNEWNTYWKNLFRDVVNKGIIAHKDDMVAYAKMRLFKLVSQAPYVALVGSPAPTLFAVKNAIRSIADQAAKDETGFEKTFNKLRTNPKDIQQYMAMRKQYMALMDRSQVVNSLLQYPSPEMQSEADSAVFRKIAQNLSFERQMNQMGHNVLVTAGWVMLPIGAGYLCTAVLKIPGTVCSGVILAATTGLGAPYIWQSFSAFNQIFGEMFASQQVANNEANALAQSSKLARIDLSASNPKVLQNMALRDLDEVDSAYDAEIFQIVAMVAGTGLGAKYEVPKVNALYQVLKQGLDSRAAIESPAAAKDAAKLMKVAKFLSRLNPFNLSSGPTAAP